MPDATLPDSDVPAPVDALIAALPKVELHLHLEGAIRPELLLELAEKHGVPGVPTSLEDVRRWYEFRDFAHFIEIIETAETCLRDEDDFARLVDQTAESLAAQNVRYAEIILSPQSHMIRGVDADAIFSGIERGRVAARERHGIELRWVVDFAGHWGVAAGETALDAALGARLESLVGFTVGGLEVDRDPFAGIFARARGAGLHSIPHAGEVGGPERMWSAIHALGAERIGHGIRCVDDPALVDHLAATGIPLDVCPASNLRTRAVTSLEEHPLPRMVDAGLVVTLNTDDPTMFDTDLGGEYRLAHRMGLSPAALVEIARDGVRASYAPSDLAAAILSDLDHVERTHL